MIAYVFVVRRSLPLLALLLVAMSLSACASGSKARIPTAGEVDADKYLFERGTEALQKKHWLEAREYFRKLVDTYPRSTFREEAKIGVGDSFLGEGRVDSLILGANEFREFLTYFPLDENNHIAQYKLALCQAKQVLSPQRDQTATRDALRELDTFVRNYPRSPLMPDALKLQRETRDLLSESEFLVGQFYFRIRNYPGAVQRLRGVLEADPGYTNRDAVYFVLAESLSRMLQPGQAKSYYEMLVAEFKESAYLLKARERLVELEAVPAVPPKTGPGGAGS
jgi:outer membrane protein assembly factor BamD